MFVCVCEREGERVCICVGDREIEREQVYDVRRRRRDSREMVALVEGKR